MISPLQRLHYNITIIYYIIQTIILIFRVSENDLLWRNIKLLFSACTNGDCNKMCSLKRFENTRDLRKSLILNDFRWFLKVLPYDFGNSGTGFWDDFWRVCHGCDVFLVPKSAQNGDFESVLAVSLPMGGLNGSELFSFLLFFDHLGSIWKGVIPE